MILENHHSWVVTTTWPSCHANKMTSQNVCSVCALVLESYVSEVIEAVVTYLYVYLKSIPISTHVNKAEWMNECMYTRSEPTKMSEWVKNEINWNGQINEKCMFWGNYACDAENIYQFFKMLRLTYRKSIRWSSAPTKNNFAEKLNRRMRFFANKTFICSLTYREIPNIHIP